jgi:integrase
VEVAVAKQNVEHTSSRVKLTEDVIRRAEPVPPKRPGDPPRKVTLLDTKTVGFGVSVNAHSKGFVAIRRVHGKQIRFKFARVGELSLQEARTEAERLLVEMSSGVNPIARKRSDRAAAAVEKARGITLREAIALREASMRARGRGARTIAENHYTITKYLAAWLDRPLVSITRAEARQKHAAVAAGIASGRYAKDAWRKRGPGFGNATANRVFQILRTTWLRAAKENDALGLPPTLSVDWFPEGQARSRIAISDLPALMRATESVGNTAIRDVWSVLLRTGMRKTSVLEMRWEDVDLAAGVLHVPRPKGGAARAFDLPLPAVLIAVLKERRAVHEKFFARDPRCAPWVFASPDARCGHVVDVRLRDAALGVKIHDARRLFASVAEAADVPPYSLKLILNHALPGGSDVTAKYLRIDTERLRALMETISEKITVLARPTPPPAAATQSAADGNIVPITRARRKALRAAA